MLELIVFVLIIVSIVSKNRKKQQESRNSSRQTTAAPQPPRQTKKKRPVPPPPAAPKVSQPARNTVQTFESSQDAFKSFERSRPAAERYDEWFPVPQGKVACRCGYCGADNLIPRHSSPSQYSCYFCRENL